MVSSSENLDHTLVIARYKENISWIKHVPKSFRIIIYNKSKKIPFLQRLRFRNTDRIQVMNIPNLGREAETYLRYLKKTINFGNPKGFTVFCQGDPFEHSPDFLKLLNQIDVWEPLQPLSYRWRKVKNIPPQDVLEMDKRNFVNGLRVRIETFSLYSLSTILYPDAGIFYTTNWYFSERKLPKGINISQHFLEECGLPEAAASAAVHNLGVFTFGAIFAVSNQILNEYPKDAIQSMYDLSISDDTYSYLFERHWLHIFGKPFLFQETQIPGKIYNHV